MKNVKWKKWTMDDLEKGKNRKFNKFKAEKEVEIGLFVATLWPP
jgi:hypothetical protein